MSERVCVVTGVGPGTGAALVRRFAADCYRVAMLARTLGPQGVHVAYVVIDAVIDVPWTRRAYPDRPDSFFIRPEGIADAVHHVVHQEPSAWTFELDLRPHGETW